MPLLSARGAGPPRSRARRLASLLGAAVALGAIGCKGSSGAGAADAARDGTAEAALAVCPAVDDATDGATDEFGPHATAAKTSSSLGRVNVYEATSPR